MRIAEAKNEDDLIAALEQARQRRMQIRRGHEMTWWNSIALVNGDHYSTWNPSLAQFEDRDPFWSVGQGNPAKKPKLVINHALTVARTELAKLVKSRPIMEIIANSDEGTDIAAAKVGRSALDYAEWKFKLAKIRKDALWWMIQTGIGAVYVGYDHTDDNAGEYRFLIDPSTGDPVFLPLREKQLRQMLENGEIDSLQEEKYPLGEVEYKVFSPFQLFPDETAIDWEQINDLITSEVIDVDVLYAEIGRPAKDLKPDAGLHLGVIAQRMLARGNIPTMSDDAKDIGNAVAVHSWWCLPGVYRNNAFLKDGKFIRWCKGRTKLDYTKAFPFQDGRMPFCFFTHVPVSTSIWPKSVLEDVRGPNLEIDKTVSQLIENKDYMANPMWRVATQHRIKNEIKNVPGAMVRYRHSPNIPPPEPIPGVQMPQQVENIIQSLQSQILDISGQSEVARGRVPTGVRSGVAVAYLQEEDDTKIAPTIENMEFAIAYMGSLTLERFSQFYTLDRILRFYRRDGMFEVLKFKGADLKNNTDVICQAGSAMPRSKAARQQYVLELVSLGIEQDPHWIKQALELGEGEPDDTDKAIAQANRENNTMMHGSDLTQVHANTPGTDDEDVKKWTAVAVPVKAWHNHPVHIQRHTSVMMDEEFDRLVITHPEIVRIFDEHLAMHQQMVAQQQQQQMQALQAAKGAPTPADMQAAGNGGGPPGAAAPGGMPGVQPGVIATTEQPDILGGGSMGLRTRNRISPGGGR